MRQRVVLAPRNAGEAVAVAVSAVLLAGSAFAVAHEQVTQNATVSASYEAEARTADVRTVSQPRPRLQRISVDGSRLPHVPVFIADAPEMLANVVTRNASPRTDDRASDPRVSSPMLGALGDPESVTIPTTGGLDQDFPSTPPTSIESPSSEASPTTEPTESPTTPTETTTPTEEPTTPPETTPPPTEEPTPDPSPDTGSTSEPTPGSEDAGVASDAPPPADPVETPPADDGGSEPQPEANGPQSTDD